MPCVVQYYAYLIFKILKSKHYFHIYLISFYTLIYVRLVYTQQDALMIANPELENQSKIIPKILLTNPGDKSDKCPHFIGLSSLQLMPSRGFRQVFFHPMISLWIVLICYWPWPAMILSKITPLMSCMHADIKSMLNTG